MATPFPPFPRIGGHDERQLLDWIRNGGAVNAKGPNGLTPLCAAALRGHPTTVQLLLKNGADVNLSSQHDCTALWFGTRLEDEEKAYHITDILLKAGANVTCRSSASMLNTTPLMNALRAGLGLKVLCLLLAKQMAKDLAGAKKDADFLKNKVYIEALKDPKRVISPPASRSFLVRAMHSLLGYLVAVVNKFTNNALFTTLGLRGDIFPAPGETTPDEKVFSVPQFDSVEFNKSVTAHINSTGLNMLFPPDSPFLEKVVQKASSLAEKGNTALATPEHLPGLAQFSLYQPIIFCDNSSSMNEADRIDSIVEVARRITEIATYLVPDDEGVVLRFLNSRKTECDLYEHEDYKKIRSADVAAKMIRAANYDGCTMLGTELRNQILTPYVYEALEKGPLPRPVLISILTDGEPNNEDDHELDNAILECKKKLEEKGYDKRVVSFQISQIGDDPYADEFLQRLQTDPRIKDYIFCTSEKLDDKFKELHGKNDELEIWLLKTLIGPLLQAS